MIENLFNSVKDRIWIQYLKRQNTILKNVKIVLCSSIGILLISGLTNSANPIIVISSLFTIFMSASIYFAMNSEQKDFKKNNYKFPSFMDYLLNEDELKELLSLELSQEGKEYILNEIRNSGAFQYARLIHLVHIEQNKTNKTILTKNDLYKNKHIDMLFKDSGLLGIEEHIEKKSIFKKPLESYL